VAGEIQLCGHAGPPDGDRPARSIASRRAGMVGASSLTATGKFTVLTGVGGEAWVEPRKSSARK